MILSTLESDAVYGPAAKAWNAKVTEAASYSSNPANVRAAHVVHGTTSNDIALEALGSFSIIDGGAGADHIYVGKMTYSTGAWGTRVGSHGDVLTGGAGADNFIFWEDRVAGMLKLSTGTQITRITDFDARQDHIALAAFPYANVPHFTSAIVAPMQVTAAKSVEDVWTSVTPLVGGTSSVVVAKVVSGAEGHAWLYLDNSNGRVDSTSDMLIDITGVVGTFTASNIIFANY